MRIADRLLDMQQRLLDRLGPRHWWPADSPFEVALGAILTQNTNWTNVEKALDNIRRAGLLDPVSLATLPEEELAELIRSSGYYRLKANRLKSFLSFLESENAADLRLGPLRDRDPGELRQKLLAIKGVGPETCDSILLYALDAPIFVVDAYTWRILTRHGLITEDAGYGDMQQLFMDALEPNVDTFKEFHALIVHAAKDWCRKNEPLCQECPLGETLP
ncbi:MAG: endonuclease related protein [Desulfovibrionales bacterium]|nr:endonuclease related protein [Desulfovibrionales bacterium]